jgi:hypothetical protein
VLLTELLDRGRKLLLIGGEHSDVAPLVIEGR